MTAIGHRVSFWGNDDVLELNSGDSYTALSIFSKAAGLYT